MIISKLIYWYPTDDDEESDEDNEENYDEDEEEILNDYDDYEEDTDELHETEEDVPLEDINNNLGKSILSDFQDFSLTWPKGYNLAGLRKRWKEWDLLM